MPKATVIIAVYNKLHFLQFVLAGLEIQTEKDFDIIIADDGSNSDFIDGIQKIIRDSQLHIQHLWHEDKGFRKNIILNKAIVQAKAPYLIFLDGDCIPHPNFIEEHLRNADENICLAGRRVDLSQAITDDLSVEKIKKGALQSVFFTMRMLKDFLLGKLFQFKNGLYFKNKILRQFFNRKEKGLLGANFSLYKSDLLAINGFDERYNKPTFGEDSDIEFRLKLSGVQIKTVLNIAVAYHCKHKLLPRPEESKKIYEEVVKQGKAYTAYGIEKSL